MKNIAKLTIGLFCVYTICSCELGIKAEIPRIQHGYTMDISREENETYIIFDDILAENNNEKWSMIHIRAYNDYYDKFFAVWREGIPAGHDGVSDTFELREDGLYYIRTSIPTNQQLYIDFTVRFPTLNPIGSEIVKTGPL